MLCVLKENGSGCKWCPGPCSKRAITNSGPHFERFSLVILGSFWGSFWGRFGDRFWIVLGSFWDQFGIVFGSVRDQFGIGLGSFWGSHFLTRKVSIKLHLNMLAQPMVLPDSEWRTAGNPRIEDCRVQAGDDAA